MSTNTRIILIIVAWLLYTLGLIRFCSRDICEACGIAAIGSTGVAADTTAAAPAEPRNDFPLAFRWTDMQPYKGPGFDSLRTAILSGMNQDNILEITGLYFEDEASPADHETMGLARASRIRDLFFPDIPKERISLRGRLIDEQEGVRENYFEGALFAWITPEKTVAETVEELEDRIIIRFPFNSTEKDYDPKVDEYLKKLAKRVVQTGEQVRLTGHTDNIGEDKANMTLASLRAEQIKRILVKDGVNTAQIITESKGETQPVASNNTDQGRHNNRRVEVRLLKKQ